jgi:hypothetical protein
MSIGLSWQTSARCSRSRTSSSASTTSSRHHPSRLHRCRAPRRTRRRILRVQLDPPSVHDDRTRSGPSPGAGSAGCR